MDREKRVIALEARINKCSNVLTLGVHPNFCDYTPEEADLIRQAEKIYYPTLFYADLFDAMGKKTFPSYHTYKFAQDKIKQTALFHLLQIPHPHTRVFHGKRQKARILDHFEFPFVGKIPRGSARGKGVFLIQNRTELNLYCAHPEPAYIQEFLESDRDVRAVVIGEKVVHAYWRVAPAGEFRCNVSVGATICLDPIPKEILDLALFTAKACCWNDVGIDICEHNGNYYVLEANVKYGKEGFRKSGIDYYQLMEELINNGEI